MVLLNDFEGEAEHKELIKISYFLTYLQETNVTAITQKIKMLSTYFEAQTIMLLPVG